MGADADERKQWTMYLPASHFSEQIESTQSTSARIIQDLHIGQRRIPRLETLPLELSQSTRQRHRHGCVRHGCQDGNHGVERDRIGPARQRLVVKVRQDSNDARNSSYREEEGDDLERPGPCLGPLDVLHTGQLGEPAAVDLALALLGSWGSDLAVRGAPAVGLRP